MEQRLFAYIFISLLIVYKLITLLLELQLRFFQILGDSSGREAGRRRRIETLT